MPSAKMDGALGSPGVESQAEPLPSLKRPCSGMPAGTPWGKLQKTEVSFVPRQSQPSPVRAEGEWCKANGWKRNQPLNMEPLTTPLPPMRPVRNISSIPGAAPDSSVPDTPLVTEAANDAAEDASADCPLATLDPYGSPVTLDPYGDGFDVNAFGDEPTPSDAYAVYGEDLAASDEPAPSEEERAEPEVLECVVCGDESAESHIGELEPDDATVVQLMARPSTDAIDVPQKCPPEDAIATMCLTIDQFKVVGPAEWSALVRAQYEQLGTQFRPDNITSRPVLRTDTEKWQLITSSRDLLMKLIDEACLRPFYDLLLYPGHRPGMKLALMCSRCPACLGESANKSENQYGHLEKSQKEIYSCPFGGSQFCSYATETKRFLFQGVSQGQSVAAAFEDLMDARAVRTLRRELEMAFEQQEQAQLVIQRAGFVQAVSEQTRQAGVPNHSAPMASISPEILHTQNDSVLVTTTTPTCIRCSIRMMPKMSQYGMYWDCPNFWKETDRCTYTESRDHDRSGAGP